MSAGAGFNFVPETNVGFEQSLFSSKTGREGGKRKTSLGVFNYDCDCAGGSHSSPGVFKGKKLHAV